MVGGDVGGDVGEGGGWWWVDYTEAVTVMKDEEGKVGDRESSRWLPEAARLPPPNGGHS